MSFNRGDLITASGINSINEAYSIRCVDLVLSGGTSNLQYNSEQYYCRGTGKIAHGWCSYAMWGGIEMHLQKLENGEWVTKYTLGKENDFFGGSFDTTCDNQWGDGWYRIKGEGSLNVHPYCDIFPAQKDCNRGELLTIYDNFTSSGNRLTGTLITYDLLNSGRGGTY